MRLSIIYLALLIGGCSETDKSRYVPMSDDIILDTHTGKIYKPKYSLPEYAKEYGKIDTVVIIDLIKGFSESYPFYSSD